MRIEIDPGLCESNGVCVGMAPDVFDFGDDDHLQILLEPIPGSRRTELLEVVGSCPRSALTVVDQ